MFVVVVAGALIGACGWLAGGDDGTAKRRLARVTRSAPTGSAGPGSPPGSGGRGSPPGSAAPTDTLVPSALDVLAACLYSGAPLEQALLAVAAAFGGEIGDLLGGVGRRSALGAPPEVAWELALVDPRWANAARAIVRAHYSGAPLTDVLNRTADERRRELRAAAHAGANRASVRAVLPLGLCFLPAFVLVGIVPVIAGFAGALWR